MSGKARIDSSAVLTEFRASLTTFTSAAATALDEAGTDIQRTLQWLREDQYRHWKAQVQTRMEKYTQAKLALKQREVLDRAIAGTHSACVDERRAVQITEKRLRHAEEKFKLVRVYSRQIEKESLEYKGAIHGLINALEVDIPNACASLDRMVDSLQKYAALAPPEMAAGPRETTESSVLQPCDTPPADRNRVLEPDGNEQTSEHRGASE